MTKREFQKQFKSEVEFYDFEIACNVFDEIDTIHNAAFLNAAIYGIANAVRENINSVMEYETDLLNTAVY